MGRKIYIATRPIKAEKKLAFPYLHVYTAAYRDHGDDDTLFFCVYARERKSLYHKVTPDFKNILFSRPFELRARRTGGVYASGFIDNLHIFANYTPTLFSVLLGGTGMVKVLLVNVIY